MSIFPKKLTHGETCIIHLNFKAKIPKNKVIQYFLKIYNPTGKLVYYISKYTTLVGNEEDYERQLYYPIYINNNFLAGKYIVDFYFYFDGNKIVSRTVDNDYFIVDKITHYIDRNKIYVKNESSEDVEFDLILENNNECQSKKYLFKGNEYNTYDFNNNNVFIKYANGKLEKIYELDDDDVYFRNPLALWKEEKTKLNIKLNDKDINLKNEEIILWKKLNGFTTLNDILQEIKIDVDLFNKIIKKFKENNIIIKKNNYI